MTVGIVVVSHSSKIAEGAVELATQMASDVGLVAAGGTDDGRIGTSFEKVLAAVEQSLAEAAGDGVVVLTDLGSAVMTAESVKEFASEPDAVHLADAPLVEGLVAAAVAAQGGAGVEEVRKAAEAAGGAVASPEAGGVQEPDVTADFELINPLGMHARPAAKIAGGLSGMDAEVTINGADGASIMELMTLAAGQGATLHVEARGEDAQKAVDYVRGLVADGFGEL
ncbi:MULTISPECIES: dihydroxyacetone kinase phosphoryl donor subunit DhaM [Paenarthrobacter]|jgi:PTS hybrid protein|uniref:dihydroxyacetone kinase phosphoryl donor subunit DhaM n=1 Tax=Paenarthrobacter TaxID=1742992 RepID=UPI00140A6017|nr:MULTISPECIES: dihydroxyacetone kinase phosphoryl donor subunit DhaM [Paenarthrobacter]MCX8456003.1 dihydroxyacetone kinase phosphoryl donor subunit DhaM [Paenarthrobacter ureafaciens]MCY0975087.1 dihydroxyacetone kinase phosphoryl donor subunit DhaM [Paenarthrobacter ureafaciens]QOT18711.1 PTS-dependent dihydroxyacetone kinase phosphotransferase subunit DhaM [Paenarthrobacter sp. YJN-5]QQQ62431.1 PTS-dependent dihydroxyacetone kinase phosphotransferase subunit DhaM [Paenarthrobacter ureafaci